MWWGQREWDQTQSLNYLSFGSSNPIALWFRLRSCVSGMRPLFRIDPKRRAIIFFKIIVPAVQLLSLHRQYSSRLNLKLEPSPFFHLMSWSRHISPNLKTRRLFISAWCRREDILISGGSALKMWDFRDFSKTFCHICVVTGWPTMSA